MRLSIEQVVNSYKNQLFVAAFSVLRNREDAEDVVQETFIKYFTRDDEFASEEHIKAWLLRVAINKARNLSKTAFLRRRVPFEEYMTSLPFEGEEDQVLFNEVLKLPQKMRIVVHLYYYEDKAIKEIAEILEMNENTVKARLSRGRKLLKEKLKEAWNENE